MRSADGVGLGLLHLALLDRPAELLLDLAETLVEHVLVDLADDDVPARLGADLGDSVAHQPAAEDANLAYLHLTTPPVRLVCARQPRGAQPTGARSDGSGARLSADVEQRLHRFGEGVHAAHRADHHDHLADQAVAVETQDVHALELAVADTASKISTAVSPVSTCST